MHHPTDRITRPLGAIIECVRHLYFCKKRDFLGGDSKDKWDMVFLWR